MDNYSIISLVGEGSFGRVYKATEKEANKTVALKVISKRGRSDKELKGLRRECEIQRNLQHPNIIQMLDSFETENEIVAITEFAKTDLHTLLTREGSLGEAKAQKLTFDLVSAMYYLHSHRILHRDLKPQNILLDKNMCAKLCDFGLARNMTMGTHVLTSIKGTPLYMAPELLEAKPYDHHADLWSLGCIIYEMLAGEPPFSTTSILHLVRLIRHEYIKWPSFLTRCCISFLQGLLVRDPIQRMTWSEILSHPFVKGKIMILDEDIPESPFTHPLTASQSREKEKQAHKIIYGDKYSSRSKKDNCQIVEEDISSSRDSVHAILQSDMECLDTDVEEGGNIIARSIHTTMKPRLQPIEFHPPILTNICLVPENPNLMVNHFNDNFPLIEKIATNHVINNSLKEELKQSKIAVGMMSKSQELERRKLSQNIDNFSVRLEATINNDQKTDETMNDGQKAKEKLTPALLPGWDSCDESQNPPIENEEWLVFLQKSMQEILDGELDSLKQQNFVSIIVAPLRNSRASSRVIENVVQLLSLPLAIEAPLTILEEILTVYVELKLVPNLVYASKLLCHRKPTDESHSSASIPSPASQAKLLSSLDFDQVKTLAAIYDLICYLIHLRDECLNQFCDAIAILGAKELFVNFLSVRNLSGTYVRLACAILALLSCALRELPENAEIVEKIIFDEKVNLVLLLKHGDPLLRLRSCMLFRILSRFCCVALQQNWKFEIKEALEFLLHDVDEAVRMESSHVLEECKHLVHTSVKPN